MSRYFYFTKRNTGYTQRQDGTHISLRALYAEEDGKFTAGKFRTTYGIPRKSFDALVMIGVVVTKEWHHTGKSFKKNDYYEWDDEEYLPIFLSNKDKIADLGNQLATSTWQYRKQEYISHIEDYDTFKKYTLEDQMHLLLTNEERKARHYEHEAISSQSSIDRHVRYTMHCDVDAKYTRLAQSRMNEDNIRKAYLEKYGEQIKTNEERRQKNIEIKAYNLSTNGRENILMSIASIFFAPVSDASASATTDLYDDVYEACADARVREQQLAAQQEHEALEKERKAKQADAAEKQRTYLNKCIKSGKATPYTRVTEDTLTDLCHTTLQEMQGKYGWFKAKTIYNLPIYHTGYRFSDKRTLNHYIKLGQII